MQEFFIQSPALFIIVCFILALLITEPILKVGEESGSLDDMSSKVADFYEEDVDNAVDNLSSLLEPLIMSILGVLVGGLVVAMYLPIFKMGSVI